MFATTGFKKYGYVFYPNACLETSCHIHFLLHGCGTQGEWIVYDSQYGEYAVSNNIIMVYPQIVPEFDCHDTYGYTGENFATLAGVQTRFYINVIERLKSERDPNMDYTWYNLF